MAYIFLLKANTSGNITTPITPKDKLRFSSCTLSCRESLDLSLSAFQHCRTNLSCSCSQYSTTNLRVVLVCFVEITDLQAFA
jgi:hypothetical protein